jgi:cation diffusion facilitator family transporter
MSSGGQCRLAAMAAESKKAIVAAIIGNIAIATIKFVAAGFTGSSAMISEGIHSLVDTGNGVLLYYGLRRGDRPPDEEHAFGHGMEVYFWSLIVAISIFAVGGGVSIFEGVTHIIHPTHLASAYVNYIVLALSAVFEGMSFTVAWRAFKANRGSRSVISAIRRGKDPSLFTVVFEDSAALLGLFVAFAGVLLSDLLHMPRIDGAASVVIGLILVSAAIWLAAESRSLLVGEVADPEIVEALRGAALCDPAVMDLGEVLTMHLGPEQVLLNIEVTFRSGITVEEVDAAIRRIEGRIRLPYPQVTHIFVEVRNRQTP